MLIESKIVETLKKKLEEINTEDTNKLIKQYQEIVNKGEIADKAGIGMGILEMAKKSENKLAFDFVKKDEQHYWLYIQTKILKEILKKIRSLKKQNFRPCRKFSLSGRFIQRLWEKMVGQNMADIRTGREKPEDWVVRMRKFEPKRRNCGKK